MVDVVLIETMAGAMMRAARSMGYYDESHPVFVRSLDETMTILGAVLLDTGDVTLGCGGGSIVFDTESPPHREEHCADLAQRMFERSMIGVRLHRGIQPAHIASLLKRLAIGPARIRAEGGMRALLAADGATTVEAIEVDYERVFRGDQTDLSAIIASDPIIERALREVLAFRAGDGQGHALEVKIDELTTPDTLGGFLDELLDEAPSSLTGGDPGQGTVDTKTFNQLASRAFLSNQKHLSGAAGSAADLAASARALSDRLVRLAPRARLELLIELGGQDQTDGGAAAAVGQLGQAMGAGIIAETLASGLASGTGESPVVEQVANLVKRLRPLEKDRAELLKTIDLTAVKGGGRPSGLAWQIVTDRAMERPDNSALQLHSAEGRQRFVDSHRQRLEAGGAGVAGFEIFGRGGVELIARQTAIVVSQVLESCQTVASSIVGSTQGLLERLETNEDYEASTTLITALATRADIDRGTARPSGAPTPRVPGSAGLSPDLASPGNSSGARDDDSDMTARVVLSSMLRGGRGTTRVLRWAASRPLAGATATDLLLDSLETTTDPNQRRVLVHQLAGIDANTLQTAGLGGEATSVLRYMVLIETLAQKDVTAALRLVRHAMRSVDTGVKNAALRSLTTIQDARAVEHLGIAAGAEGDERARALLGFDKDGPEFHTMQEEALSLLPLTRSALAVPHVSAVLTRRAGFFFRNKRNEELRRAAAQALAEFGTQEADEILQSGLQHRNRAVRALCSQVLAKRQGGVV